MSSGIYDRAKANLMNGECDLEADVINVALMKTEHSFNSAHNTWAEVSDNELPEAGNYSPGGQVLAGKEVTQGATTKWDATDVSWADATFTAFFAVLFDDTLENDDLIACIDFGGGKSVSAGTFKIQWHENGIITLATAA